MGNYLQDDGEGVVICLPTFNEKTNLPLLINKILCRLPKVNILVIDDNSPNGTGKIADELAALFSSVCVLHRKKKEGLGRAYISGFYYVINRMHTFKIIQMDADFSHPISMLPCLIKKSREFDLVIGSRHIAGGSLENWNIMRRLISRFGSRYARFWLPLPIRDLTSGLKIWNADLLKRIIQNDISANGYVFQIEMTYLAWLMNASIAEVPFRFVGRNIGQSKMSIGIALEAFWKVPLMGIKKSKIIR